MENNKSFFQFWLQEIKENKEQALADLEIKYQNIPEQVNGMLASLNPNAPEFVKEFYNRINSR